MMYRCMYYTVFIVFALYTVYTLYSYGGYLRLLWLGREFFSRRLSFCSRCLRMLSLSRISFRPLPLPT